ncbi:MAG: hypothetical protein H6998_00240 [Hahellaceae bacterium]|nr:hypothetical protein [Hahellaceae bacterium]
MKKATIATPLIFLVLLIAAYVAYINLSDNRVLPTDSSQPLTPASAKSVNERAYQNAIDQQLPMISTKAPRSLSNINHEADLGTDNQGNLLINDEITQLFEFYLSAMGEEPLEVLLTRIQQDLAQQLSAEALQQALGLLKRYVDYKIALTELAEPTVEANDPGAKLTAIRQQKADLMALRSQYFTADEHQAFFEDEEVYDDYMLNRLSVSADDSLDAQAKQERITALEKSLPDEVQALRQKVSRHADLFATTEAMKQSGASNEALFQVRAASLGTDAAQAMARLDADRKQWQQRLNRYVQERNQLQKAGLTDEDKQRALNRYIEDNFTGTERLRVRALDSSM